MEHTVGVQEVGWGGGGLATPPMFSVWSDSFYVKVGRIVLKNWENLLKND
jgi:hypothetical protein